MKNTGILALACLSLSLAVAAGSGCSSSSTGTTTTTTTTTTTGTGGTTTTTTTTGGATTTTTTTTTTGTGGSDGGTNPAPPAIGMQLDRIGRPAVNTALNHGFDGTAAAGTAKDAYNADSDPTKWASNYAAQFAANLAVIDALDGVCGNQIGYTKPIVATSYATVAGALTDDRLYLKTNGTTHTQYLAVEANLLGVTNADQGGRTLDYNVMDTTYSVLAAGALTGVSNGITMNNKTFSTSFPYEAAPN